MAIQNNPELEAAKLTERANYLDAHRRHSPTEGVEQTAFPLAKENEVQASVPVPAANPLQVEASVTEETSLAPTGHGLMAYLRYRIGLLTQPGLSLPRRLRLLPGVGYLLGIIKSVLGLPRTQHLQSLRMDALQVGLQTGMQQAEEARAALQHRIAVLESLQLPVHLERYRDLDIGSRLMRLEKLHMERQLQTFRRLLQELRDEDAERAGREQQLQARVKELEQAMLDHGVVAAAANVALSAAAISLEAASAPVQDRSRFYVEFEALFRGQREDIKQRLRAYIPQLSHILEKPKAERLPVVDVGCGRGEWLELMAELDIPATGVDMNGAMVEACLEQGLYARQADAIAYLRSLPAGSLAAVTGFHIIEHLPFEVLLSLFEAAQHALCSGGVVIFETPNPENLKVGACNFYFDPTHLSPVVPQVAEFMARQCGFAHAEILRLHPYPEHFLFKGGTPVEEILNKELYGPQDYAVLGRK
jgi:O-antigen chain-terminating methyltransferase